MDIYKIYYAEINTVCIVILLFLYRTYKQRNTGSVKSILYMKLTLLTGIVYCFSDIGAALLRGEMFTGAKVLLYVFNSLYILTGLLISYFWLLYANEELDREHKSDRLEQYVATGVVVVSAALVVTTPWSGAIFRIDDNNLYSRGPLIFVQWITTGGIMIIPTIKSIVLANRLERKADKDHAKLMALFIVAPLVCYGLQNIFYGITTIQVGYTISALIMILRLQSGQITKDPLTGLNNRSAFDYHIDDVMRGGGINTGLVMIDIDNFKYFNEEYGRVEGDNLLRDFGKAIMNTCKNTDDKVFAARFGKDEFAFVFSDCTEEIILNFIDVLKDETVKIKQSKNIELSFCEGHVIIFNSEDNVDSIIKEAYDAMLTSQQHKKKNESKYK